VRRGFQIALIGFVLLVVIVGLLSEDQDTTTAQKEEPAKEEKKEANKEEKQGEPARFEGRGNDVITGPLSSGLHNFTYTFIQEGSSSALFQMELLDPQGRRADLIANEVVQAGRSTEGAKAVRVPSDGTYTINVKGVENGPWTLEVR